MLSQAFELKQDLNTRPTMTCLQTVLLACEGHALCAALHVEHCCANHRWCAVSRMSAGLR